MHRCLLFLLLLTVSCSWEKGDEDRPTDSSKERSVEKPAESVGMEKSEIEETVGKPTSKTHEQKSSEAKETLENALYKQPIKTLKKFRFRNAISICDAEKPLQRDRYEEIFQDIYLEIEFYNEYPFVVRKNGKPMYVPEAEIMPQEKSDSIDQCLSKYFIFDYWYELYLDFPAPFDEGYYLNGKYVVFSMEDALLTFEQYHPEANKQAPLCTQKALDGGYTQIETCVYQKDGYSLRDIFTTLREKADDQAMPVEFLNYNTVVKGKKSNLIWFEHPRKSEHFYDLEIRLEYDGGMDKFRMYETDTSFVLVSTNFID